MRKFTLDIGGWQSITGTDKQILERLREVLKMNNIPKITIEEA